jgi:predicted NBD/HSP70 family sugar kinase
MYSFYLGIDLHRRKTYAVLIDKAGEVIDERQILTHSGRLPQGV